MNRLHHYALINLCLFFLFLLSCSSIVQASAGKLGLTQISAIEQRGVMAPASSSLRPELLPSTSLFFSRRFIANTLGKNHQVLLTFDDGPHPRITPNVIAILKSFDVKAVFFLLGINVQRYPELVRQIHAAGHTIGNHSFRHPVLTKLSPEKIREEIRKTNLLIEKITGEKPRLCRPPYGIVNKTVMNILDEEKMSVMLWNIDPRDWRNRNASRTMSSLRQQLRLSRGGKGGIILLHDTLPSTVQALPNLLRELNQANLPPTAYSCLHLTDRSFWQPLHLNTLKRSWPKPFQVDAIDRVLLSAMIKPEQKEAWSGTRLLRAKKSGTLFHWLLQTIQ